MWCAISTTHFSFPELCSKNIFSFTNFSAQVNKRYSGRKSSCNSNYGEEKEHWIQSCDFSPLWTFNPSSLPVVDQVFSPLCSKGSHLHCQQKKCDRLWRFKYRMNRVITSVLEKNVSHVRSKNKGRLHLPGIFIKNISLSSSKRKLTAASKNSLFLSPSIFQVSW